MKKQELTITPALIQKYAAFLREQERAASTVVKYVHELTVLEILLAGRPVTKGALLEWKEDLIGQYTPASVNNKLTPPYKTMKTLTNPTDTFPLLCARILMLSGTITEVVRFKKKNETNKIMLYVKKNKSAA